MRIKTVNASLVLDYEYIQMLRDADKDADQREIYNKIVLCPICGQKLTDISYVNGDRKSTRVGTRIKMQIKGKYTTR